MSRTVRVLLLLACFCAALPAQILTGTITGTVTDSSDQVIVGAKVTLVSESTGESRSAATGETGAFSFPAVRAGAYTVKVDHAGFRPYQKTGNVLTSNERLAIGTIRLELGALTETVSVTAEGAVVQTMSAERSALLAPKQLEMLAIRGRDVVSMLRVLPGVSQQVDTENLGGSFGTGTPNIQGARNNWNSLAVDGLTGNDLGSPSVFSSPINLDAIGEVKVLLNNYQAELGRNGGAFINIVTKSGTREYHGSGYWYKRHEQYNANNFFNNRTGVRRPLYRYATVGATFGGPAWLPGLIRKGQEKLFIFYSYEQAWTKNPQGLRQVTMPTELERRGDFSQTLDVNGRLIPITDPTTRAPFPGNAVPASRINLNGQAILNIFPLPNLLDRGITRGNYNFQFQESTQAPRWQHLFRADWKPTNNDSFAFRGSLWYADQLGYAVAAGGSNWGLTRQHYTYTDNGAVMTWTRILSPSLVNEFMGGLRHGVEKGPPEDDEQLARVQRGPRGLTLSQFFRSNNPLGIIPQASFGGVPSAAAVTYDGRYPLRGADTVFDFSDNLTWNRGSHTIKAGFTVERVRNYEGEQGNYGGNFDFGRDTNNPFDSNYAYANALLGNFRQYSESSARPSNEGRKTTGGGYVQDTWRLTRRLTLDFGLRFTWYNQWWQASGLASSFALERFDPRRTPQLYRPALVGGQRRAVNPLTGEALAAVYIGAIVTGSGDPFNGAVIATDSSFPRGFREQEPLLPEPRFGFAWDVFGAGKTAVRGGFGLFHNTVSPGVRGFAQNPPTQVQPNVFYGNLDTFLATSGVLFPNNTSGFTRATPTPSLYNFTLGVQQDIGFATVVDVAYVGSLGRHLQHSSNINTVPYGARFLPQNADPANPATPLNDNFFRPYPGWGNITLNENVSTSSYNALQVTVNRRFVKGVLFGIAYTWSKTMNYVNSDGDGVARYRPLRVWNYGKAGYDQTHILIMNYTWDVPGGSRLWPNRFSRMALDGWQFSGITSFYSGFPSGVGFSTVDGIDITGGGDGSRIVVTGKSQLSHGARTFGRFFEPTVFRRPARGDFGNSPKDVFRAPGANNWDISLFKNFLVGSERRYFQFRLETYNTFNHSQWSGVDSTARFDAQGNQVNARFGEVTGARTARLLQASLRFNF